MEQIRQSIGRTGILGPVDRSSVRTDGYRDKTAVTTPNPHPSLGPILQKHPIPVACEANAKVLHSFQCNAAVPQRKPFFRAIRRSKASRGELPRTITLPRETGKAWLMPNLEAGEAFYRRATAPLDFR